MIWHEATNVHCLANNAALVCGWLDWLDHICCMKATFQDRNTLGQTWRTGQKAEQQLKSDEQTYGKTLDLLVAVMAFFFKGLTV